ncbi:hypothetical protein BGZ80_005316 [Entomortierella chlamydospora]|uniref:Rab-GAP TBC domain-containing protein n=1 Tax=Entomortierella chlamydospora TaxID=101097 RepID=A0A9P6MK38_9FUNG|nr:hypothetical protein BGZ79_006178 [Entomortierella chlamydospora]KAG0006353.1 hypothetical protein BGZ80_005316 [Entomortierella chlamydospora]
MILSSIPQQQQQQPRQLSPTFIYRQNSSSIYHNLNHNHFESSFSSSSNTPTASSPTKYNKRAMQQYRQEQLDSMSITVEEYEEVLNSEVWVEVNKLRDYASHGISRKVRGEVWLYLLGIQEADRSKEVSARKQKLLDYEQIDKEPNEMTKRARGEISRYLRKTNIESCRNISRIFEDVISAYCNHNHRVEYYPAMVNLCAPFIYSVKRECDAFLCFEKMINTLDDYYSSRSINESVASFMTLFRTCIPDLYSYFEEEEVDIKEWAASALQFVLSRELSLENLMRLWDTYFAVPDWIELHPYFCLAVLKHLKEGMEELEQSEIRTILMRLPNLEMDQIVNEAFNLRHEIKEREVSENL